MSPTILKIIALIALAVVAVPYLLGPILIYALQRFRVPVNLVPLDPQVDLPLEARRYFGEVYEALTKEGFELVGTMGLLDVVPNTQCVLALYANRASGDQAMSTIIVATGGLDAATLKTRYVEFVTRFDQGTVVQTNNSFELGAFKPPPTEHTTKFWDVQDVRQLYSLHQLSLAKYAPGRQPVLRLDRDFGGDALAYGRAIIEESFADQVPTGYLRRCSQGFAPTIKGAFIMTWQELWPLKKIRRARCRREALAALAEFRPQLDGK